ncbi:hypothetical protein AAC387_Pa12g1181 [Persea americana]
MPQHGEFDAVARRKLEELAEKSMPQHAAKMKKLRKRLRAVCRGMRVGGTWMKTLEEAFELLEEVSLNAYQWQSDRPARGINENHSIDTISALSAQMEALGRKMDNLNAFHTDCQHSILHGINEDNAGLYHPSLITDLCKAAGVVWSKGEEIQQPKWIIYAKLIEAMEDNDEDPGAGSGSAAHAMPTQPSTMQARMAALEAQVAYFGQYHQSFVNIR